MNFQTLLENLALYRDIIVLLIHFTATYIKLQDKGDNFRNHNNSQN